ncbi:MAG: GTPase [Fimbriimonadaceae bacterium]
MAKLTRRKRRIRETVDAATSAQLRQANAFRNGKVREEIESIRDQVVSVLTAVEASTDFSEEIGDLDRDAARAKLESDYGHKSTLSTADIILEFGREQRCDCRGSERRQVFTFERTSSGRSGDCYGDPRTTRDTIEATVELGGLPVRFVDTAGIRETQDEVERIGVYRSRQAIESADLVIHLIDLSHPEEMEITHDQVLRVGNKADLAPSVVFEGLRISALTGEGLDNLVAEIRARPGMHKPRKSRYWIAMLLCLKRQGGQSSRRCKRLKLPFLMTWRRFPRSAARFLGEITGETTPPDVIDRIFHEFCIGK